MSHLMSSGNRRRTRLLAIAAFAALVCVLAPAAPAAVQVQPLDDVFPMDDPRSPSIDEGLPGAGSQIDPTEPMTAADQADPRVNYGTPPASWEDGKPYFESRLNVIVGRTQSGTLIINSGSDLRYEDLIIGGYDETTVPLTFSRGSGTVRIEGTGSLYNNNYLLLPPALAPGNPFGITWGDSVRAQDASADGFDLYVGRQYDGVLSITQGGRAEIQDAVVVGDSGATSGGGQAQFEATGRIIVDGFESTLISGGFLLAATNDDLPHQMIIGRLGSGTMDVTNGGRVIALGPLLDPGELIVGAVLGGDAIQNTQAPGQGGQGTVRIDGPGSVWTVGGNLQIGGFHDARDVTGANTNLQDLEGNDVDYSATGRLNTLTIQNGGRVNLISPFSDPAEDPPNRIDILVGRSGRIVLNGGSLQSLGVLSQNQPGSNPIQEVIQARLLNDGVVSGSGEIQVLQFNNRVLGDVRVGAGQKLTVSASADFAVDEEVIIPTNDLPDYPLSNYGLIEVIGNETNRAEIEFTRQTGTPPSNNDPLQIRRFLNLPITVGPGGINGRTGGEIVAQDAALRFMTGIVNSHKVSFTGGTNEVTGDFFNEGSVFVAGGGSNVTFVDQFFNRGNLQLAPAASQVMFVDDVRFEMTGEVGLSFGGAPAAQISSAESILLGGTLRASLFPNFTPQAGTQYQIISSATGLTGDFDSVFVPDCVSLEVCFVGFPDYDLNAYFIRTFSTAAAVGADFDGSGLVNDLDLAIWEQNVGGPGPAGDANGDGIVNGADLAIWFAQEGGEGMAVPGGGGFAPGGGGLAGSGAVPEPASLILFVGGALLALAKLRSRRA